MDKSSSSTGGSTSSSTSDSRDITTAALGCGSTDLGTPTTPPPLPPITLNISTTTGGNFTVVVDAQNSMENLKKIIAKKLKVAKDRICLLHRERELHDGTLKENGLMDGSKIILIPNVETGLLAQRPENTVMQALESLNDSQVNDFLSGKTPLNLSMRLGDHMMLIQLQLSTVNPSSPSHSGSRSRSSQRSRQSTSSQSQSSSSSATTASTNTTTTTKKPNLDGNHHRHHHHHHHHHHHSTVVGVDSSSRLSTSTTSHNLSNTSSLSTSLSSASSSPSTSGEINSFMSKQDFENLQNIVKSISMAQQQHALNSSTNDAKISSNCCSNTTTNNSSKVDQSPIKPTSSVASSLNKTTSPIRSNIPVANNFTTATANSNNSDEMETATTSMIVPSPTSTPSTPSTSSSCPDPISAKLTSCLCKRLDSNSSNCETNQCSSRHDDIPDLIMEENVHQHHPAQHSQQLQPAAPSMTSTPRMCRYNNIRTFIHKTLNNPINKVKHRHHHPASSIFRKNLNAEKLRVHNDAETSSNITRTTVVSTSPSPSSAAAGATITPPASATTTAVATKTTTGTTLPSSPSSPLPAATTSTNNITETTCDLGESVSTISATDSRALAEASRNLTQTLRKLSKEVFTSKVDLSEEAPRKNGGAVIESMKNHGKGIYSGTFSGTLNPALQDRYGRPKRDISTVIHILNDLLSAAPPYSRNARISFESSGSTTSTRSSKQITSKCTSSTITEPCSKCVSNIRANTCSYGGCSSNSRFSVTPAVSTGTCPRHHGESHQINSCSCRHEPLNNLTSNNTTLMDTSNSNMSNLDRNSCTCNIRNLSSHKQTENVDLTNNINGIGITTFNNQSNSNSQENPICSKCSIEIENNKTKCKLDQLRLVMQQRKQRREARKMKGAPYGARVVSTTSAATTAGSGATTGTASATTAATASTIAPLASPSEVSPNHIVEEVDTAA